MVTRADPVSVEVQQALLEAVTDRDAPWWLEEGDPDPGDGAPPEECDLEEVVAECRQDAEDRARAAATAARLGAAGALGPPGPAGSRTC